MVCHPDQKLQMADSYQVGRLLLILTEGNGVLVCRCLSACIVPVGAAGLDGPDHLHGGQVIMVMSAGAGCKGVAGPEDRELSPHLQTFFNPSAVGASQGAKKLTSGKCVLLLHRPMIFHASSWSAMYRSGRAESVRSFSATCYSSRTIFSWQFCCAWL